MVELAQPAALKVKSGQSFMLSARPSRNPDGDGLSFHWFYCPEAGTYKGKLPELNNSDSVWIVALTVKETSTFHVILRVSDKGEPPTARYTRTVVTVES